VPLFADDRAVYGALGRVLSEAVTDERSVKQLRRADAIVQFRYYQPDAAVTLTVRAQEDPVLAFGKTSLRPDVVLAMDADVGHAYFLGEVNPTVALGDGRIKTRGAIDKTLAALALIKLLAPRYQALISDHDGELPPPLAPTPRPLPADPAAKAAPPAPAPEGSAGGEGDAALPVEGPSGEGDAALPVEGAAPEGEAVPSVSAAEPPAVEELPASEEPAAAEQAPAATGPSAVIAPSDDPPAVKPSAPVDDDKGAAG